MSQPTQTCQLCGNSVVAVISGRGFPPDTAAKKLKKLCNSQGCECDPKYRAGIEGLERLLKEAPSVTDRTSERGKKC